MKSGFCFLYLLFILTGCIATPRKQLCTSVYLRPDYAYTHTEEKRFQQVKDECEPDYKLDREAFHKSYIEGKRQARQSYCGCENGYYHGIRPSRGTSLYPEKEILDDPLYVCEKKDGKKEYLRGIALAQIAPEKKKNRYPKEYEAENACLLPQ